jgi:hypothetical protein
MTQHAHPFRIIGAAVGVLIISAACGGSSTKKSATATPASGVDASSALKTTAASTVTTQRTLAGQITVLPDGRLVTAAGTSVPAAVATELASLLAAGPTLPTGATPASTTGVPAQTAVAGATVPVAATAASGATVVPLCVADAAVPNCATPPPEPTPTNAAAQGIAFDSDTSTASPDSGDVRAGSGQSFTLGLVIASAPSPYQGYSWDIVVAGPIAYVSDAPSQPADLTTCGASTLVSPTEIYGGCITTRAPVTYTGAIGTVTLRCTGAGSGQVSLRRPGDPGDIGFATELIAPGGAPITGDVGPAIHVQCS